MSKTFVTVTAEHNENGLTKPLFLTWTDGRKYEIDRITDVGQAPSLKGGGLGEYATPAVFAAKRYTYSAMKASGLWRGNKSRKRGDGIACLESVARLP